MLYADFAIKAAKSVMREIFFIYNLLHSAYASRMVSYELGEYWECVFAVQAQPNKSRVFILSIEMGMYSM